MELLRQIPLAYYFNPHSRVGSDALKCYNNFSWLISIHTPAWGATVIKFVAYKPKIFQSTLPRGERPETTNDESQYMKISIHTPAWGATSPYVNGVLKYSISIHTPAWGATERAYKNETTKVYFNPHSRVGSDNSYHRYVKTGKHFNPHSRVGSDLGY